MLYVVLALSLIANVVTALAYIQMRRRGRWEQSAAEALGEKWSDPDVGWLALAMLIEDGGTEGGR